MLAPRANAIAERWIGSARRKCLDRMLIASERHLRLVLREYADHYNTNRPHRALNQNPPGQEPDQRGHHRSVGPVQPGPWTGPAQYRDLLPQHQEFGVL